MPVADPPQRRPESADSSNVGVSRVRVVTHFSRCGAHAGSNKKNGTLFFCKSGRPCIALLPFAAHGEHWGRNAVLRQLGLPLLHWIFGDSGDDGVALEMFAQGFVSTLKTGDAAHVKDAFEALAPLVARLEPESLASALRAGGKNGSRLAQSVGWLVQALVQAAPGPKKAPRGPFTER